MVSIGFRQKITYKSPKILFFILKVHDRYKNWYAASLWYNRETLFVNWDLLMFGVPLDTRFDSRQPLQLPRSIYCAGMIVRFRLSTFWENHHPLKSSHRSLMHVLMCSYFIVYDGIRRFRTDKIWYLNQKTDHFCSKKGYGFWSPSAVCKRVF